MIGGMKMIQLLCVDNLDCQKKVFQNVYGKFHWHKCYNNLLSDAEAINMMSTPDWYSPSTLSFFALDNVGCNGTESNLLDCLPQHNCNSMDRNKENAGVQCLRKGIHVQNL